MDKPVNVLIAGVGGQGIILASEVLATAAMDAGYDVKQSEVHGMAQRGGAVVSHVRFGKRVWSPMIEKGTCDLILSFEKSEALRWTEFLKPGATVLLNTQEIIPVTVTQGLSTYPHDAPQRLREAGFRVFELDALGLAEEAGTVLAVNIVMLGAASHFLPISTETLIEAVKRRVPPKFIEVNLKAFQLGRDAVQGPGPSDT